MGKVSFADVQDQEFEPLPKGKHAAELAEVEYVPNSQSSDKPSIAWTFVVVSDDEYNGRKAFMNTSLQPQALWSTQRVLKALGMSKEEIDVLEWDTDAPETIQDTLDDLQGEPCVLRIAHETFEGVKRQRIRRVMSPEEGNISTGL